MYDSAATIEKRLRGMGVIVIFITLIVVWRMFDIQILQHSKYISAAQKQQRFDETELAQRGKILVHDSTTDQDAFYPLAFDVKSFDVWAVPKQIKDKEGTAKALADVTGLTEADVYSKINNDKLYIPPIKKGLNYDQSDQIKNKDLAGVFVMPEYSRYYPESSLASQVIGFVNAEGQGKYGFEGHYNTELTGTAGSVVGEKDTLGRVINLIEQKDPQDGINYVLTVDRSLQYYVEKKLAQALQDYQADYGTVVVMDVKTGGILAMASNPTFDPNNYKDVANSNPGLFVNPAITNLYEPGSIFKPLVMSAAIDQGLVTPDTSSTFDWHTFVDGHEIKTAELKAFGLETMTQVLENSDNVGMVWVGDKLGNDNLYKYVEKYNFLNKTGIDLDGEQAGYTVDLKNWKNINRATVCFGQGILVSPIELVSAYAAIANDGKYVYPHMVDKMIFPDGSEKNVEKQEGEQVIKSETAKEVAQMLVAVVKNGTAKKAQVPGFQIAAKTGTAQIAVNGVYDVNDTGLGIYNHSAAGFAPADNPRFAMLVWLGRPKSSKYAESTAVPLFGDIASYLINDYYRLTPSQNQ